jgi:hypothetical protein
MNNTQKMSIEQAKTILGLTTDDLLAAEKKYKKLAQELQKQLHKPGTLPEQRKTITEKLKKLKMAIEVIRNNASSANSHAPGFNKQTWTWPPNPRPYTPGTYRPAPPKPYTPFNTSSNNLSDFLDILVGFIRVIIKSVGWFVLYISKGIFWLGKQIAAMVGDMMNCLASQQYHRFVAYLVFFFIIFIIPLFLMGFLSSYLSLNTAQLRVLTVPWSHVSIDGKRVGISGESEPFNLSPGRHKLYLQTDTGKEITKEIFVKPRTESVLKINFKTGKTIYSGGAD